jgi:hypothetical protein
MLEREMTEKPLEQRIAKFVRMMSSNHDGEVVNAIRQLGRLLTANGVGFNDLGDAIEKLATGGLEEAAMKRVFDAGYQKAAEEFERKRAEGQAVFGLLPDGRTIGGGSLSTVNARKLASKSSITNSLTTCVRG